MVNRGGRSKGCKTCRARRVKCDEKRPFCTRCVKAGVDCGGYAQFAEFVLIGNTSNAQQCHKNPANHSKQFTMSQRVLKVPDESIVHITYLMDRLLSARKCSDTESTKSDWLLPLPDFKQSAICTRTTHRSAVEALAAAYFGRMHHDQRVMDKGAQQYVQTLAMLHADLSDGKKSRQFETLASVLCLGMYENVILSSSTAWLAHFDGISRIVETRGPAVLSDEREMELFRRCRFAVIVSALMHRRNCFLATSLWKEAIRIETAEDHIHAIFAEVPGIQHDFHKLLIEASTACSSQMRERVEDIVCSLHRWERCWAPLWEPYNLDGAHDEELPEKPTIDAPLLALQKAILLCLGTTCEIFQISLKLNKSATQDDKDQVSPEDERLGLAVQICNLAETCLRQSNQSSQKPFLFVFPMQVASRHLRPGSEEAVKSVLLMEYLVADTHGFELGRRQIDTGHQMFI